MKNDGITYYLHVDQNGSAAAPRPLDPTQRYLIGRSEGADFILDDTLSSREHCALQWDGAAHWTIEDLGSRNGTYVNGERLIQLIALDDHDVVQVGGKRLVLRLLPLGGDPKSLHIGARSSSSTLRPGASFTGTLSEHGLQPTLRFLACTGKSGRLTLDGGTDAGALWYVAGFVRHAEKGDQQGPDAIRALCSDSSTATAFAFYENEKPTRQTVTGADGALMHDGTATLERNASDAGTTRGAMRWAAHLPMVAGYDLAVGCTAIGPGSPDVYDVGRMADGTILVTVAEILGGGDNSAQLAAALMRVLRRLRAEGGKLGSLLASLQERARALLPPQVSLALFAAQLRPSSGTLTIALFGYHPALGIAATRERSHDLGPATTHTALGANGPAPGTIALTETTLEPGTLLVQCSRRLLVLRDSRGNAYGRERLQASAMAHARDGDLQRVISGMAEDVARFANQLADELTILVLRRHPNAGAGSAAASGSGCVQGNGLRANGQPNTATAPTSAPSVRLPVSTMPQRPRGHALLLPGFSDEFPLSLVASISAPAPALAAAANKSDASTDRQPSMTSTVLNMDASMRGALVRGPVAGTEQADADDTLLPPSDTGDPLIGRKVGHVRLQQLIANGRSSRIYRGRHVQLNQDVAVKLVPLAISPQSEEGAAFVARAKAAMTIKDEHVVQVLDAGLYGQNHGFLVMPLITGGDLATRLLSKTSFEPEEFSTMACALAQGLTAIHAIGQAHLDLCPANILLDAGGDLKITTLAMSHLAVSVPESPPLSAIYRAPETLSGTRVLGPAADVYGLGAILAELAELPQSGPVPDNCPIDARLAAVIQRCLLRDPATRSPLPLVCEELQAAILRSPQIRGAADPLQEAISQWRDEHVPPPRPSRWLIVAIATIVVVIAGLIALAVYLWA